MFSISQLSDDQKATIAQWVSEGADLSTIQKRVQGEFEMQINYMDTRFMVSDLGLTIQEEAPAEPEKAEEEESQQTEAAQEESKLCIVVDEDPIPGCMISGIVTFSDGEKGMWYIDEAGRPGLNADSEDYEPSPADIDTFQHKLHDILAARQNA